MLARPARPWRTLAAAVRAAGLRVVPLPGASSVTAALSVAGAVASGSADGGFVLRAFLPVKNAERASAVQRLAAEPRCVVLPRSAAPHPRAGATALAVLGKRAVTLAREPTKQFEDINAQPAQDLSAWLDGAPQRARGEFVVLLHPVAVPEDDSASLRVLQLLLPELPLKTAVRLAADITAGAPRNALYESALALRKAADSADKLE